MSFPRVHQATIVTSTGQLETLPVRLAQLSVPALAGLRPVTPDPQARVTLACGQGPALTVDGRVYPTSVSGTAGQLSGYLPLQVRLCAPGGTLSLAAGRHTLTAAVPGTFAVTDLSLSSVDAPPPAAAPASGAARAVTIRSWQPDQRTLTIGSGTASYLEIHENDNPGWAATLNGRQLTPVRLDGWQQAFIVPAGPGGTITLTFRPAVTYHLALIASILAAALLLALAAWSFLAPRRRKPVSPSQLTNPSTDSVSAALDPLVPADSGTHRFASRRWPGVLAVAALIFVAGRARWPWPRRCWPAAPAWRGRCAARRGRRPPGIPPRACPCSPPRPWSPRGCCPRSGRSARVSSAPSAGPPRPARSSRWPPR